MISIRYLSVLYFTPSSPPIAQLWVIPLPDSLFSSDAKRVTVRFSTVKKWVHRDPADSAHNALLRISVATLLYALAEVVWLLSTKRYISKLCLQSNGVNFGREVWGLATWGLQTALIMGNVSDASRT